MNELKDTDLREALRRREARRRPTEPSDDFCDRVMQDIDHRGPSRTWLYAAMAVAASLLLLLTIDLQPTRQGRVEVAQTDVTMPAVKPAVVQEPSPLAEVKTAPPAVRKPKPKAIARPTAAPDSTAILMAELEAELTEISDSCYMARLEKTIASDEHLSRAVDDFINAADAPEETIVYVKAY